MLQRILGVFKSSSSANSSVEQEEEEYNAELAEFKQQCMVLATKVQNNFQAIFTILHNHSSALDKTNTAIGQAAKALQSVDDHGIYQKKSAAIAKTRSDLGREREIFRNNIFHSLFCAWTFDRKNIDVSGSPRKLIDSERYKQFKKILFNEDGSAKTLENLTLVSQDLIATVQENMKELETFLENNIFYVDANRSDQGSYKPPKVRGGIN